MVILVISTTIDPASIGPASALLAMPGWHPGPSLEDDIPSFVHGEGRVRLVQHSNSIVEEDDLDKRWEAATGEVVDEVIFLSKHKAASNKPALTIHPIGIPHLNEGEVPLAGGKPGWAAPPNPRMGSWLRRLKTIANNHNLLPEFEITLEATHHGPIINVPTMFLEIGSTEEHWPRQDAAQVMALLVCEGLGLGGSPDIGNWSGNNSGKNKVLFGIGGGHYVPRHMDIVMKKDCVWVGHLISGYALPMEEDTSALKDGGVGGNWRKSITVSFEATKSAFPGGEIIAHLDHKSFKGWQKNAIVSFLVESNIKVGKPNDFN
ncbi:hypothetical protein GIB67_040457 [Kingdonia uniflora]|uniref:D-aminoacyl-tRNA deacylase n=1 Tax=Kingdonia uniflora TaxID=39325 RepID=A0A7J7L5B0_9MAGN|nr:hypothetical protein GIB67_040457 [Kingdonia uniflora]